MPIFKPLRINVDIYGNVDLKRYDIPVNVGSHEGKIFVAVLRPVEDDVEGKAALEDTDSLPRHNSPLASSLSQTPPPTAPSKPLEYAYIPDRKVPTRTHIVNPRDPRRTLCDLPLGQEHVRGPKIETILCLTCKKRRIRGEY